MEVQSNNNENKGFFSKFWWSSKSEGETKEAEPENVQPGTEAEKVETVESQTETDSCRKKKAVDGEFLANVKDHFDEFVNTPMDQHRICLKKTIQGLGDRLKRSGSIFGSSKTEPDLGAKEVKASAGVQTTTAQ